MSAAVVTVAYADLEMALHWVSADGGFENRAFISKADGTIHCTSEDDDLDEEVPDDIDDETRYWCVPDKHDLDLGRQLVERYVRGALPEDYDEVRDYFRRRGAYARFKALLDRRGHLERWSAFESRATQDALLQWAAESGLRVSSVPPRTGT